MNKLDNWKGYIAPIGIPLIVIILFFLPWNRILVFCHFPQMQAAGNLRTLATLEHMWKICDYDGNGEKDYWTGDVFGLHGIREIINPAMANADIRPLKSNWDGTPYNFKPQDFPTPFFEYYYQVMLLDETGQLYADPNLPPPPSGPPKSPCTNLNKFGFVAFPANYQEGNYRTFIINQERKVYSKDLGPNSNQPERLYWPGLNPEESGWKLEG